jgi:hypothetical protein
LIRERIAVSQPPGAGRNPHDSRCGQPNWPSGAVALSRARLSRIPVQSIALEFPFGMATARQWQMIGTEEYPGVLMQFPIRNSTPGLPSQRRDRASRPKFAGPRGWRPVLSVNRHWIGTLDRHPKGTPPSCVYHLKLWGTLATPMIVHVRFIDSSAACVRACA